MPNGKIYMQYYKIHFFTKKMVPYIQEKGCLTERFVYKVNRVKKRKNNDLYLYRVA